MRRLLVIAAVVACGAALAAVLLLRGEPSAAQPLPKLGHAGADSVAARGLAAPLGRFGVDLLAREAALTSENVVVSPASLHAALSMLLIGAAGQTATEMRSALELDGLAAGAVNQGWADLIASAQYGKNPELQIADSLWLRKGIAFRSSFLDLNRDYFAAELGELLSDPKAAADKINAWVKERTAGKITQLISPEMITPNTVLALVNTIHLKVHWKYFDKADTKPQPFTLTNGEKVDVPMMQASVTARAASTDAYDAVCLKTDGPADVWVIVPKGTETPESVLKAMQAGDGFAQLTAGAVSGEGSVALPRLSLKYTAKALKDDMKAAGMVRAFDPDLAEFPGVADVKPEKLYVEAIVQKATLDMNEQGVEAAAATGVTVGMTAVPANHFQVRADRPYLIVITEHRSAAPLFMALVRDPR
jgi:serine protease inhibitor